MTEAPTPSGPAKRGGGDLEWIWRPLFGLLLAGLALAALIGGGGWFAGFIAAGTIAGVREWHRMVRQGSYAPYLVLGGLAIAVALALPVLVHQGVIGLSSPYWCGLGILAAAAAADAVLALGRGQHPLWQAVGPLYLGVPGLALFGLRATPDHGLWLVLILFAAVWGSDTGALVSGRLIGGPKLIPRLSPNKTWAGFLGGIMMAAVAVAAVMVGIGASPWRGALFGAVIALVSHAGDLFESWVKRRMGRKDSGHLIPGHGGVLDRIDSILFAAPVCAAIVYLLGVHAIFGVQP